MAERLLPHSIEAEMSVIGAIIINQALDGAELLNDMFYDERHNVIYQNMIELSDEGKPIDLVTLTSCLQDNKQLPQIGGVSYLAKMANSVPTASNLEYYAQIIKNKHIHRLAIMKNQEINKLLWESDRADEGLAEMYAASIELSDKSAKTNDFATAEEVAFKTFEQVEQRSQQIEVGVPSGFKDLDDLTNGFQKSDLIILAARPSVGKTALALNIANNASTKTGRVTALFSLEMSSLQLMQRMISSDQNIDANKLRTGYLGPDDWERMTYGLSNMAQSDIFIDDTAAINVYEIARKCRKLKKMHGLDLIIIDYLQLIVGRGKSENRQQEVSEISRSLKRLAKELDVPVIALSQLSRKVEERADKRPMLSDLRESGSIEQDADIVAFLYRDDYYDKETENKNIIEVIIAKQRNGPTGTAELVFLKQFNKFVDKDKSHQQAPASKEESKDYAVPDMYRKKG